MRTFAILLLLTSFSASAASPFMSVKERLRVSLWIEGITEKKAPKKVVLRKPLPEELERALQKI